MSIAGILWLAAGFAGYVAFLMLVVSEDGWTMTRKVILKHKFGSAIVCAAFSAGGLVTLWLAIRAARMSKKAKFFWN